MAETLVLDPTTEDATNTQLTLTATGSGIDVLSQDYPAPDRDRLFASSVDTEGDPYVQSRYRNRVITLKVRCFGAEATMRARVAELTKKVGKLAAYGGTFKRTLNDGDTLIFDVCDADIEVPADHLFAVRNNAICTVTLQCKPFWRGTPTSYSAATETTNPELVFSVAAPAGDVPALGLLEITESQAVDQWFVHWGMQGHTYPGTATSAALSFAGTSRLALNGATALAVSGAVSGTVLNQGTLTTSYGAVCSLASSGTAYPSHTGTYNVWARLYMPTSNGGTVTAALEWAQADLLNYTRNDGTVLPATRAGGFMHVKLGQVRLDKVLDGAQRWDARLIAKSSAVNDDLAVDRFYLFPVERYGEARGVVQSAAPTSYSARDEFNQTAGTATGKTLPVGGTWQGAGDTDDFTINPGQLERAATSDASTSLATGRLLTASTPTTLTNTYASVALPQSSVNQATLISGLLLRYVDSSNFLAVYATAATGTTLKVVKRVAGTDTTIATVDTGGFFYSGVFPVVHASVTSGGVVTGWLKDTNGSLLIALPATAYDAALATGGTLATGTVGIIDRWTSASALTRVYDGFYAYVPANDAAMFASRKLQIRDNQVRRQDPTGSAYYKPNDYRGDYLLVPPAQHCNSGTVRMIVKAVRNDPYSAADTGIDDISATLTVTPRGLAIPE